MPTIFELYGFPLSDPSDEAERSRQSAHCPFMGLECDGGGNRELSRIDISDKPELQEAIPLHPGPKIAAGVCSIQVQPNESPWIVCPRRLFSLGRQAIGTRRYQINAESRVLSFLQYPSGTRLGVWPEVKLEAITSIDGNRKEVDYTFDYIVMPVERVQSTYVEAALGTPWRRLRTIIKNGGYTLSSQDGSDYIEDFPVGIPSIIEIMTSSTSGGNKTKRTTIPMAFTDALLRRPHQAPGINYRQVWARMVSQLIVKSEFAIGWGGKTLWIVQDKLLSCINTSTALNLQNFAATHTSDVNMVSFSYEEAHLNANSILDLSAHQLYAGPLTAIDNPPSIQDITRAPFVPPLVVLLQRLINRVPVNYVITP